MKRVLYVWLLAVCAVLHVQPNRALAAGVPGDAEAATHGDEAASLQVVGKADTTGFVFRQYNLGVLSHYSYLIGSQGECLIVDPARDVSRYLKDADKLGLKVTRVYLTHSHADFVAGHMELAQAAAAKIYVNKATAAKFPHTGVSDRDEIRFGNVRAVVLTTPGHTPDGTCLLVHHPASAPHPKMALTGDTLFIGSVGRPDLLEGAYTSAQLASMIFDSWQDKLSKIPDETLLYPAHGAGSLCGAHLSDRPVSTFGEQKKENPYIQHTSRSSFVMAVIADLPEAPQYFKHNVAMNRAGPPLVDWDKAMPPALDAPALADLASKGAWLIDVRDAREFAAGHVQKAINIGIRGRFETWTGIMVAWAEPVVLIGSDAEVQEAAFRLHRIGYDKLAGCLKGAAEAWAKAGLPTQTVTLVKPIDLHKQMQSGAAPIIVDVRLPSEWMGLRIGDVLNMPITRLSKDAKRLDPAVPVLMVCNSAYRSIMAAGLMQQLGFKDVRNLEGGSEAWINAGLPTYGAQKQAEQAPPGVYVNLPERITPEGLAKQLMDLPGSFEVVDVRPKWQFEEFHIAGSTNVPIEGLMGNPAYLVGKRPLVVVCRDGAISAAIGGALVQKSQRPVKFLSGGVMRYYDEIMRPAGIASESSGGTRASAPMAPAAPAKRLETTPAPASPRTPTKKRAGC